MERNRDDENKISEAMEGNKDDKSKIPKAMERSRDDERWRNIDDESKIP